MPDTEKNISRAEKITCEYMSQIFNFALKKTSSRNEAEDFAQNVMLEILTSLLRGSIVGDEKAWVWKITRNHYAKWARRKHELIENSSDELPEERADSYSVEDDVVKREEEEILHRELSLLRHDYRYIVCEYYFNNLSLSDISASIDLPLGTVKRKICECRKNLSEGMKMARNYGKRSFTPEHITFVQNWNPCTAEDLSLELGIAMPYMEEEIKILEEADLLICENGKYKTNMVILSKSAQDKLYDEAEKTADKITLLVKDALEYMKDSPLLPENQSFDELKPTLVERYINEIDGKLRVSDSIPHLHTIRHKDGSEWALVGLEKTEKTGKSLEVWGDTEKFGRAAQVIMLGNRRDIESIEVETERIPIISNDIAELFTTVDDEKIIAELDEFMKQKNDILNSEIPDYLKGNALVVGNVDFRRLVMDRLIASGYIRLADDMTKSASGIWFW
ncbi:MAG: sigma-70 family RNA polymerase sigma factor [Firmicutes bacterium]|nr:sigma-70 family RNA polymerase sigma factor [Bacillota bacterium]